jgi:hypothetical protein
MTSLKRLSYLGKEYFSGRTERKRATGQKPARQHTGVKLTVFSALILQILSWFLTVAGSLFQL